MFRWPGVLFLAVAICFPVLAVLFFLNVVVLCLIICAISRYLMVYF